MKKICLLFACLLCFSLSGQLRSQEIDPRELFSQGYALFSQGNLTRAEELFRKTLDQDFVLEDYSLHFLGQISMARIDLESSRGYLLRLRESFPQSVWLSRASLELGKICLAEKDYRQAAQELQTAALQGAKREVADEARYLLAQLHEALEEWEQAYSVYQELRRTSPLSTWAAKARQDVRRLREQRAPLFELATAESLSAEAELLVREREYPEAEKLYRRLLQRVRGSQRVRHLLALADVYRAARKRQEAIPVLTEILRDYPGSPDIPAALHTLGMIHWNRDENLRALNYFKRLRDRYPKGTFVDVAYYASARIYESLGKWDDARRMYQVFSKRFPESKVREEALWRLAWLHYQLADYSRAHTSFKQLGRLKATDRYKSAALYWQARSAEKLNRTEEARQLLTRLLNEQVESYYSGPAEKRLERMGVPPETVKTASPSLPPDSTPTVTSALAFHLSRARALGDILLSQLAVPELDAIKDLSASDPAAKLMLVQEYARHKAYHASADLASQIPYSSEQVNRYRYPLAYWDTIRNLATEREVDPYLVVALIRQESLFDPKALSSASAFGLMQLLPATAARTARQLGLTPPEPGELFQPDLNLILGINHLKELLQRYDNNRVKAIAAYNAGVQAVARWEQQISAQDEEEFIEKIPYAETRLYVKLVLRNHRIYRRIYDSEK